MDIVNDLNLLFYKIFGKKNKRLALLKLWHRSKPNDKTSVREIFKEFIQVILYEKEEIELQNNKLVILGKCNQKLCIPFTMIENDEIIQKLFNQSDELFSKKIFFRGNKHFRFHEFKLKQKFFLKKYRRAIIRDFIFYVYSRKDLYYFTLHDLQLCIQDIIVENKGDEFVGNIYYGLCGPGKIIELLL